MMPRWLAVLIGILVVLLILYLVGLQVHFA